MVSSGLFPKGSLYNILKSAYNLPTLSISHVAYCIRQEVTGNLLAKDLQGGNAQIINVKSPVTQAQTDVSCMNRE